MGVSVRQTPEQPLKAKLQETRKGPQTIQQQQQQTLDKLVDQCAEVLHDAARVIQ